MKIKATFQIILVQICENIQSKSQKQGQKWISRFKEPTFSPKSQLVKFAQKLRKSHLFIGKIGKLLINILLKFKSHS